MAHWRSIVGCRPGVWKMRERVTGRIQKGQPHFFGKPRRRKGKPVQERGRDVLRSRPSPSSLGVFLGVLAPPGRHLGRRRWGGAEGQAPLPDAPGRSCVCGAPPPPCSARLAEKIILPICRFIYLHSVMIYFDVSF